MQKPVDNMTANEICDRLTKAFRYAYRSQIAPILERDKQALQSARYLLAALRIDNDLRDVINSEE